MLAAALTQEKSNCRRSPRLRFFCAADAVRPTQKQLMIIVLKPGISKKQEPAVLKEIRKLGYKPHVMRGVARTVIGAIGDELTHQSSKRSIARFPQIVESVMPVQKRYKLVSREAHPENSTVPRARARDRREKISRHGRPLLGRERKTIAHDRRGREGGGRDGSARRRIQAAHVTLRIPGPGREGPEAAGQGAARKPAWPSSPNCFPKTTPNWSLNTRTSSKSARAMRRISNY